MNRHSAQCHGVTGAKQNNQTPAFSRLFWIFIWSSLLLADRAHTL